MEGKWTICVFFSIFGLIRNKDTTCHNWLSFKQPKRFFAPYINSLRDFKYIYYVVHSLTERIEACIIVHQVVLNHDGSLIVDENEATIEIIILMLPFFWLNRYFRRNAKELVFGVKSLSVPNASNYSVLLCFVECLKMEVVDQNNIFIEYEFIETRKLVSCRTQKEANSCLTLSFASLYMMFFVIFWFQ